MEGPMGPGAPQMAVRTGAAVQVPIAARAPTAATATVRCLPPPLVGAVPSPVGLAPPALVLAIPPAQGPVLGTGRVAHARARSPHAAAMRQTTIKAVRLAVVAGRRAPVAQLPAGRRARQTVGPLPTGPAPVAPGGAGTGTGATVAGPSRAMGGAPAKVAAPATRAGTRGVRAAHAVAAPPSGGQGGASPRPGATARTAATEAGAPPPAGAAGGLAVGRVASVRVARRPLRLLCVERAPRPTTRVPLRPRVGVGVPTVAAKAPPEPPKRGVVAPAATTT